MTATAAGELRTARELADESLKIAREIEGPLLVVCALDALAAVDRVEGDAASARGRLLEAAELGRRAIVPDAYLSSVLRGLGELAVEAGELDAAGAYFEESFTRARGVDDVWGVARTRHHGPCSRSGGASVTRQSRSRRRRSRPSSGSETGSARRLRMPGSPRSAERFSTVSTQSTAPRHHEPTCTNLLTKPTPDVSRSSSKGTLSRPADRDRSTRTSQHHPRRHADVSGVSSQPGGRDPSAGGCTSPRLSRRSCCCTARSARRENSTTDFRGRPPIRTASSPTYRSRIRITCGSACATSIIRR